MKAFAIIAPLVAITAALPTMGNLQNQVASTHLKTRSQRAVAVVRLWTNTASNEYKDIKVPIGTNSDRTIEIQSASIADFVGEVVDKDSVVCDVSINYSSDPESTFQFGYGKPVVLAQGTEKVKVTRIRC
ncbi:hypothetical protein CC78DRAFT_235197 [Lojkania enalia]|uniref:Uncharacterized protein n=1 Tax=Lojkania enalia TaxID=147567 RepID=A0A9P4N034_9PLEO|nr:hypothetical protein CC78DRAFT_235197 [Didymosphaeria enalia]